MSFLSRLVARFFGRKQTAKNLPQVKQPRYEIDTDFDGRIEIEVTGPELEELQRILRNEVND